MPEFFHGFMFSTTDGKPVLTWTPEPGHTQIYSWMTGYSADFAARMSYEMFYSRSFEEAMGTTSIMPETDIPGFQPAWRFDLSKYFGQLAYVERTDGNDTLFSGTLIERNEMNFPTLFTGTAGDPFDLPSMPAGYPGEH